jgi:hypothetical protein
MTARPHRHPSARHTIAREMLLDGVYKFRPARGGGMVPARSWAARECRAGEPCRGPDAREHECEDGQHVMPGALDGPVRGPLTSRRWNSTSASPGSGSVRTSTKLQQFVREASGDLSRSRK